MTDEELVRDYRDGLTYRAIGEKHGISHVAVVKHVKRLKRAGVRLPDRRCSNAVDVDALNALLEE